MKLLKRKIIKFVLICGSIFSIGLILTSCSLINNNLISSREINENTKLINNLSLSINYKNEGSNGLIYGTGFIFDNDLSNDRLDDNDLRSLRHYYIITNTHVVSNGYKVIKGGQDTPINQAIQTTIEALRLGYTTINNPNQVQYTNFLYNFNKNKFKVMGLGINMKDGTWRDVEVLRLSLSKEEIKNIPQFEFYEKNKNNIKFNNKPLITNKFLPQNEQLGVTAGGYPFNNSIGQPNWTQFKQKNDFQWYIGQLKQYVNNGIEFKYNAIDYSIPWMNMGPGSSGSLAVLDDNSILGNYWGTIGTTKEDIFGIVTPYVADAKMYKFNSNIYNYDNNGNRIEELDNKRSILFANFSDSPILIPTTSNFTVDMKGRMSSIEFEQKVKTYDDLINIIRQYNPIFWEITPSPDPDGKPSALAFPNYIVIRDINETRKDISKFKLENARIEQNIIKDWKNLLNIYNYDTFLKQKN